MNRKGIIKHKKVFDKWLKGADVEVRHDLSRWTYDPGPNWIVGFEYRVKPREPRVWWINVYGDDNYAHRTHELALKNAGPDAETIKVMEIIDDEENNQA